jgi:acyl-CoA synthetase (NDP forming)
VERSSEDGSTKAFRTSKADRTSPSSRYPRRPAFAHTRTWRPPTPAAPSSFAESGDEGIARQNELTGLIGRHRTRLLGPNTSGFINPHSKCTASFVPGLENVKAGTVGVVAQSGGVNLTLAFLLENRGIGISLALGLGNAADIDTHDIIDFLAGDPNTRAIVVHLEGISDGRRLFEALRRTTPKKPVVALIAGKTDVAAFAQSHTGRMLGSYELKRTMLRQAGVVVVETTDDAADAVAALSMIRMPPHRDPGVVLVTGQAGPALLIADTLNKGGVRLASLGVNTASQLKGLLPPLTFLGNPVDTGRPGPTFPDVIRAVAADEDVQLTTIFAIHEPAAINPEAVIAAAGSTPVIFGTAGISGDIVEVGRKLLALGLPVLPSPERLGRVVVAFVQDAIGQYLLSVPMDSGEASGKASGFDGTDEASAKAMLAGYGIAIPTSRVCASHVEARDFLRELGGRVVVKILAAEIAHKTEVGGVVVGVDSEDALDRALDKIDAIPTEGHKRYLIEQMATEGVELIVGAVRDETFGPIVMLGLGGVAAEAIKDSTTRLAPLRDEDALAMIEELRGKSLLEGFRGAPPVDKSEIARVLIAVSRALADHPDIKEIEINPLRATAGGVVALDALIIT